MDLTLRKIDGVFIGADEESAAIVAEYHNDKVYRAKISEINIRTPKQNSSIQVYCRLNAEGLNDSGQYMECPLKGISSAQILWTMESFKHGVWYPVQIALTLEPKSSNLTTVQVQEIYVNISQNMSLNHGINIPWPSNKNG